MVLLESVVAVIGLGLVIAALAANQTWLDRHFLPSFLLPRYWSVLLENAVRAILAAAGVCLAVVVRRRIARAIGGAPGVTLLALVAVPVALGASEMVLRYTTKPRPEEWQRPDEEPLRVGDPLTGWVIAPSRVGRRIFGGRTIEYAIDRAGYRVRRVDAPVDTARPTLVFAGESVMFGEGLQWDETIPAQVGAMLDLQSANIAVHGYTTDQVYMRLEQQLPRFRQPLAVVTLFWTVLVGRNLDTDRPYLTYSLGPGLVWHPAEHASRLRSLTEFLVPYRSEQSVESGISKTREVLHAMVDLVRSRGATPLIVVPQFGPDDRLEASLRTRILDDTLPSVVVAIDKDWRLPWDRHPNARAAHRIADAIATRLRE